MCGSSHKKENSQLQLLEVENRPHENQAQQVEGPLQGRGC